MRYSKQTGLNLAFISAVHAPVHTYLTAYTSIHGPHLSPTFFSLTNSNPHLLHIWNVFPQRHSVEHILWCYHITFQINVFHFKNVKRHAKNTCNDAILSWADPRDTFTCHFLVSTRKGCIICFLRYKNCKMYSHLQYLCNKHALLVNRIHKLRWQCLTCCTVTWHCYTHSLLHKTMPA
jgi:hypothetical protein